MTLNHPPHHGSVSMARFSAGSSLTYHLAPFVLNVTTTSRPFILPHVVFPKALFSSLYSSSCTPPTLGFIFDEHLTCSDQITSLSKAVTITFISFAVSGVTSICQQPVPLLPHLLELDYCNSLYYNSLSLNYYPASSRSRTLLLVLSLKLISPVISLRSYALSTGSASWNASNTSSSNLPTKFSQLTNLHTFITSFLFNVLAVLALHLSLLLLGNRHHPL